MKFEDFEIGARLLINMNPNSRTAISCHTYEVKNIAPNSKYVELVKEGNENGFWNSPDEYQSWELIEKLK